MPIRDELRHFEEKYERLRSHFPEMLSVAYTELSEDQEMEFVILLTARENRFKMELNTAQAWEPAEDFAQEIKKALKL